MGPTDREWLRLEVERQNPQVAVWGLELKYVHCSSMKEGHLESYFKHVEKNGFSFFSASNGPTGGTCCYNVLTVIPNYHVKVTPVCISIAC